MSEKSSPIYLRTHTRLWHVEKKLYKLYDFTLPVPVSFKLLGLILGFGLPWIFIVRTLGVPFAPPFGHLIWLAPPTILAYFANRPIAEGKKLFEYVGSQVGFFFESKKYAALKPYEDEEKEYRVHAAVWEPRNRNLNL